MHRSEKEKKKKKEGKEKKKNNNNNNKSRHQAEDKELIDILKAAAPPKLDDTVLQFNNTIENEDLGETRKAPAKRSQHFNATYHNIIGCNMLRAFGHPFATCCDMLRHFGCCWLKFENGQIFHATFLNVA